MQQLILVFIPLISALVGWFTNFIAVKMLFRPRTEVRILFLRIQGVFPRRQKALAHKLGQLVSEELLSVNDLKQRISEQGTIDSIRNVIAKQLDEHLHQWIVEAIPMAAMFMKPEVMEPVKEKLLSGFDDVLPHLLNAVGAHVEESFDIHSMVREKVEAFSSEKLEDTLVTILRKEFKFVEFMGAILGFLIGIIQLALIWIAGAA